MSRVRPSPAWLLPHLEGADALESVRRLVRPDPALARLLADRAPPDLARLALETYEERAHPPETRKKSGTYFTPAWVVDALLDRLPDAALARGPVLDPAVGAGAFPLALVRRHGDATLDALWVNDLDPRAIEACALVLEAALGAGSVDRLARWQAKQARSVDFLRDAWDGARPTLIVGNPPYGVSGELDLLRRYPVLEGNRDAYACFLLRAMEVVAPGGRVLLLVPDSWLSNRGARHLRALLAEPGRLARLVDVGKPFALARDVRAHGVFLGGEESRRPTVEAESLRGHTLRPMAPSTRESLAANAEAGWRPYLTHDEQQTCAAIARASVPVSTVFDVVYGLRTGDNARFVRKGEGGIPLVGGDDFDPFDRRWTPKSLGEPDAFPVLLPKQLGRWKVGIQRIRSNSTRSWRRWLEATLLSPAEVGLDSLTLVAEREPPPVDGAPSVRMLSLLGLVNSAPMNRWYRLQFTDVNVKPHYLGDVPVPRSIAEGTSEALARLVRRRLGSPGDRVLERAIDRLVLDAWGLDPAQGEVLEAGYWEDAPERPPLPSREDALALAVAG